MFIFTPLGTRCRRRRFRRSGGFALIVTLMLMVLLTVIGVGLLTLSSISLRRTGADSAMAEAQANARLGIMLAIGELQKSLGRDQAITAPSDIVTKGNGRSHLTGVWNSWDINPAQGAPKYEQEKTKRFQSWLVSSADPAAVLDRDFVNQPAAQDDIRLISTADKVAAKEVRGGRVPVGKNGALAWHVSDESVKARINVLRDPSRNKTLVDRRALVAGHRPGVRSQKTADGVSLDFLPDDRSAASFAKAVTDSSALLDVAQADLLAGKRLSRDLRNDLTSHSLGVLADVRKGGLKRDLTTAFESANGLPDEWVGKKLYASTHGTSGVSDPNWAMLSGYYNSYKKARTPETLPSFKLDSADPVEIGKPVVPGKYTIAPMIAKIDIVFTVVVRDAHSTWVASLKAVDPNLKYMLHLVCVPIVTLYNPYNAEIEFDRLSMIVRDLPLGFNFYVNDKPQNNRLVAYNDLFINTGSPIPGAAGEKAFMLDLANWSSPSETTPRNTLKMKPGQTLVCSPYVDPTGTSAMTLRGMTGTKDSFSGATPPPALKLRPGFTGKAVGVSVDYLTPKRFDAGQSTDGAPGTNEVLGLKLTDQIRIESGVLRPQDRGVQDQWEVSANLWVGGRKIPYGGIQFLYQDQYTLQKYFPNTYMYPNTGNIAAGTIYESYDKKLADQSRSRAVIEFSSAARTANGGVYETNTRDKMAGGLNTLRDGRLAGKPFLFHNPARTVNQIDLKNDPPGRFTHELNFQPLTGEFDMELDATNRGPALTGNTTTKGIKSGVLFELPGGPMQTLAGFRRSNVWNSSYLPDFVQPMANSAVTPLMSTTTAKQDGLTGYSLLDHSYLANHALYDSCYFSTFAGQGTRPAETVFGDFLAGREPLATQCFEPYHPSGMDAAAATSRLFKNGKPTSVAWKESAAWQMVKGSFNVNSTSVLAWKAMLSSLAGTDIPVLWAKSLGLDSRTVDGALITGLTMPIGGLATDSNIDPTKIDDQRTNEWNGYRSLNADELKQLATRIVEEVKTRGPFLSMSEFVNRRLGPDSAMTRGGALHTAIERAEVNKPVFANMVAVRDQDVSDAAVYGYQTPAVATGNPAEGAPGWITQGDLMHILEPRATVRGDTFVIRACGQSLDGQGKVVSKAYAEAVVQRVPDFIDSANPPETAEDKLNDANRRFGRRMEIISFRWLSPHEI